MTDDERRAARAAWIASRPESIQRLAAEFPLGTRYSVHGRALYLVGYNEGDALLVSEYDPAGEYERAVANVEHLCASHVREARGGFASAGEFLRAVRDAGGGGTPDPRLVPLSPEEQARHATPLSEDELRALERLADELEKPAG